MRLRLWHGDGPAPPDAPALRDGSPPREGSAAGDGLAPRERSAAHEQSAIWSRADVAQAADGGAAALERDGGIGAGTVCAALVRPSAAGIATIAAVLASQGSLAGLNPASTPAEVATALRRLRPAALVVEPGTRSLARAACALLVGEGPDVALAAHGAPALFECAGPDAPLRLLQTAAPALEPLRLPPDRKIVIWTSGTTGHPRAIALRAEGVLEAALSQVRHLDVRPGEALPASLPLAAVGGLMIVIRAALAGAVVEAWERFDPDDLLRLATERRVQHLSLVPVMLRRLLDAADGERVPGTSLRTMLVGGAATPPDLIERARRMGLPLALTWGMTESAAQAATARVDEVDTHPGTVGRPLEHLEVRVDADGRLGLRLGALDPAEIEPSGRVVSLCDAEGWFRSGDLGRLTPEGRVMIIGRAADRVISGGVNVDPVEVERMLVAHPGVAEALVVGVPDADWGERLGAVIVPARSSPGPGPGGGARHPDDGAALDLRTTLERYAREQVAPAKRPRDWRFVAELPRTPAGKPDRRAAAALWAIPGAESPG